MRAFFIMPVFVLLCFGVGHAAGGRPGTLWTVNAPSGLTLRATPSRNGAAMGLLVKGTEVVEISRSAETEMVEGIVAPWMLVRQGLVQGWVCAGFLTREGMAARGNRLQQLMGRITRDGVVILSGGRAFSGLTLSEFFDYMYLYSNGSFRKIEGGAVPLDACPYCREKLDPAIYRVWAGSSARILRGTWTLDASGLVMTITGYSSATQVNPPHACAGNGVFHPTAWHAVRHYQPVTEFESGAFGFWGMEPASDRQPRLIWVETTNQAKFFGVDEK